MTEFVIGVDGGGSKTEAVVLDFEGRERGRGWGPASNYLSVGLDAAREALHRAMADAMNAAGARPDQIRAVVWALAGAGRPEDVRMLQALQQELLPGTRGEVVTDAEAALVGSVGRRMGIVVISGTGMMVWGEDGEGRSARAGGWGHALDEGSGYALALDALRAVARSLDRRDLPTRLTQRFLQRLNLSHPTGLISWLYAPDRQAADIAKLAPLVLAEAEQGDLLATEAAMRAADSLAAGADAVARSLGWDVHRRFPLALSGGLLTGSAFFRALAEQSIRTRLPGARPQLPRFDPAVGAGLLALESLGRSLAGPATDAATASEMRVWASEQQHVLTHDLDMRPTMEVVGLMHLEDARAVAAVRPVLPAIAAFIDAVAPRMQQGGRLIYVGAGTSGRLGVLDASECPPTFNTAPDQVVGIIAGGRRALTEAVEEAEDREDAGVDAMIALGVGPLDSVVGIAASGRTPYVVAALTEARRRGALTAAIICNLPAPLADLADHVLAPLVGPEVIAGSTRLKAGTVQKLILNMISTGVMVRLGKTYGNLMVDVRQQNEKLQRRARRIVAQACGVSEDEAAKALARCGNDVKIAIVSTLLRAPCEVAKARLARARGNVRKAIEIPF